MQDFAASVGSRSNFSYCVHFFQWEQSSSFVVPEGVWVFSPIPIAEPSPRSGTYPLAVQLIAPQVITNGAFRFALVGPPGDYTILGSTNLAVWSELGVATNQLGFARFVDPTAAFSPQRFYRVRSP